MTMRVLQHGDATILGIQRDFSGTAVAKDITLALPALRRIRDLRADKNTTADQLTFRLDPVAPTILDIEVP